MQSPFSKRVKLNSWDKSMDQLKQDLSMLCSSELIRNSYKWERITGDISEVAAKERSFGIHIQNLLEIIKNAALPGKHNQDKLSTMLQTTLKFCYQSNLAHKSFVLIKCWQKVANIQIKHLLKSYQLDPKMRPQDALETLKLKQDELIQRYQKIKYEHSYHDAIKDLGAIEETNHQASASQSEISRSELAAFWKKPLLKQMAQMFEINSIDAHASLQEIQAFRTKRMIYQKHSKRILRNYREVYQKILDQKTDASLREDLAKLASDIRKLHPIEKDLDNISKNLLKPKVRSVRILVKNQGSDQFLV